MLIISDYKDYYDGVANNGIDKSVVYKRKMETIPYADEEIKFFYRDIESSNKKTITVRTFLLGFCGKIYPVAHFSYHYSAVFPEETSRDEDITFYNHEELITYLKGRNMWTPKKHRFAARIYREKYLEKWLISFFINDYSSLLPLFQLKKVPVFKIKDKLGKTELTLNCPLKDVGFFTQEDSFQCFQKIQTYLSEVLIEPKPMIEISDKDRLMSKGFDKDWSFRNPDPPKRKQK
jgi:hypothetical protein